MSGADPKNALDAMFGLVANETRLDILWTLWDIYTDDPDPEPEPVPFSTLKDRVGVRDSGRFHYHLDELVPVFVTHHEAGYTLTHAGARVVGAGCSGVYTETTAKLDSRAVDECPHCDGTLTIRYEQGHAVVDCDSCATTHVMSVPPILVERHDVEADLDLLGRFAMTQLQQTSRGFCYLCHGPVAGRVADSSFDDEPDANGAVTVCYECTACGAPYYTAATTAVLDHPVVVSRLHDAGIDYRELPSWRVRRALDSTERVRDDDPVRVAVTIALDDELTLVLDDYLDVVDYHTA
jgi:RNase P subunit RPR2